MKTKQGKFFQQAINAFLVLIVIGLLGYLSIRYKTEFDWTAGHRNTLTAGSQRLLGSMKGPVKFTAFLYPDANRTDYEQAFNRYKKLKPDIDLEFVDPSREPKKVEEYQVTQVGQTVVEYEGRKEKLSGQELDERSITSALQRLSSGSESYVVFLEGHGERSVAEDPSGEANRTDYTQFTAALRDKGLKVESLNLAKTPAIPDNAAVLVIASPAKDLLDGEAKLVDEYVARGGNLLWLTDPDQTTGDEPLAKSLGATWQKGVAIFPNYKELGTSNPAFFIATDYPPNPVTAHLNLVTAFPLARGVSVAPTGDWKSQPLLVTDKEAWLESGSLDGPVAFDPKTGDIPGPITIGLTLTRDVKLPDAADKPAEAPAPKAGDAPKPADAADKTKTRGQRIALIGDSDFLSDAIIGQVGNLQLGLDLVQWLAARDNLINVDVPKAPDTQLYLPGWATWVITGGFVLILPLLLIAIGVTRWAVRRRK